MDYPGSGRDHANLLLSHSLVIRGGLFFSLLFSPLTHLMRLRCREGPGLHSLAFCYGETTQGVEPACPGTRETPGCANSLYYVASGFTSPSQYQASNADQGVLGGRSLKQASGWQAVGRGSKDCYCAVGDVRFLAAQSPRLCKFDTGAELVYFFTTPDWLQAPAAWGLFRDRGAIGRQAQGAGKLKGGGGTAEALIKQDQILMPLLMLNRILLSS